MEGTVFGPALDGMKHVKSEDGVMLTKPFLDVCKLIIPIIEKFGAAMALVKSDIGGNITRLENKYLSNPTKYNHLYSMVQEEVDAKTAKGSSSCTNGLLWLTRAMDFLVELFRNLLQHQDWPMSQACSDSYTKTLKQWHGWLASSSFMMAMKLAPDRKKFMEVVSGSGDINADIEKFCAAFSPFLVENHKFLLDNFKSANAFQSAPLGPPGDPREEPEIKWVSEDSKRSNRAPTSPRSDLPDLPKSSRRHSSTESADSPKKKEKSRQSRRSKDSSDGRVRSSRRNKEANESAGSSGSGLPDIPKKSRRKKSKDSFSNDGSSRSRSKGGASSSDPFSDFGNDSGPIPRAQGSQLSPVTERDD